MRGGSVKLSWYSGRSKRHPKYFTLATDYKMLEYFNTFKIYEWDLTQTFSPCPLPLLQIVKQKSPAITSHFWKISRFREIAQTTTRHSSAILDSTLPPPHPFSPFPYELHTFRNFAKGIKGRGGDGRHGETVSKLTGWRRLIKTPGNLATIITHGFKKRRGQEGGWRRVGEEWYVSLKIVKMWGSGYRWDGSGGFRSARKQSLFSGAFVWIANDSQPRGGRWGGGFAGVLGGNLLMPRYKQVGFSLPIPPNPWK